MNRFIGFAVGVFAFVAVLVAQGGEFDGYVTQDANNAGYDNSALTDATLKSNPNRYFWSDKLAPHADASYYVTGGRTVNTVDLADPTNVTFVGREIAFENGTLRNSMGNDYSLTTLPYARFLSGTMISYSSTRTCNMGGHFSVEATSESPFLFNMAAYEYRYAKLLSAELTGGASAYIVLTNSYKVSHPEQPSVMDLAITGDSSQYLGTIFLRSWSRLYVKGVFGGTVDLENDAVYRSYYCLHETGDGTRYGAEDAQSINKLVVRQGASVYIAAASTLSVGTLDLRDGAEVTIAVKASSSGCLEVTDAIIAEGKTSLVLDANLTPVSGPNPPRYALVRMTGSGTLDPSAFTLVTRNATVSYSANNALMPIPHYSLVFEDGVLYAQQKEIVMSVYNSAESPAVGNSPFNSAQHADGNYFWSDHLAPKPGKDYYDNGTYRLSPDSSGAQWCEFLGDSLTLIPTVGGAPAFPGNGSSHGIFVRELNASALYSQVWGGVLLDDEYRRLVPESTYVYTITGEVFRTYRTTSQAITFEPFGNRVLRIASELTGDAKVVCKAYSNHSNPTAYFELPRDNVNFTGNFLITFANGTSSGEAVPSETKFQTLILHGKYNIGGPRPTFMADAVQIEQKCALRAVRDVTIDQENLGVRFSGEARVNVIEGRTLAIDNPITYAGLVRKEGLGTFAIGATPRFSDGAEESLPEADKNVLRIEKGFVKPTAGSAFDGVEVRFASSDSGLAYEVAPTDEAMAKYGVTNDRWPTPFVFETGVASVPVKILMTAAEMADEATRTVPLATFATEAAAQAFGDKIVIGKPGKGLMVTKKVAQNDLGTYTLSAEVARSGLVLTVR